MGSLILPRFRGHPGRREDAPGAVHGEEETKSIHTGVQGGRGEAGEGRSQRPRRGERVGPHGHRVAGVGEACGDRRRQRAAGRAHATLLAHDPEIRSMFERPMVSPVPTPNVLRLLANHPELLKRFTGFATVFAKLTTLPQRDIEIVILRHQVAVLKRQVQGPALQPADGAVLADCFQALIKDGALFTRPRCCANKQGLA